MDWLLKSQSSRQECIPSVPFNTFVVPPSFSFFSPQSQRCLLRNLGVAWEKCVSLAVAWTKADGWSLATFAFHQLYWRGNLWCCLKPSALQCCPGREASLENFSISSTQNSSLLHLDSVLDSSVRQAGPPQILYPPCPSTLFPDHRELEVGQAHQLAWLCSLTKVLFLLSSQLDAIMLMSLPFSFFILALCVFYFLIS